MSRLLWISLFLAVVGVVILSGEDWHAVHLSRDKFTSGNLWRMLTGGKIVLGATFPATKFG